MFRTWILFFLIVLGSGWSVCGFAQDEVYNRQGAVIESMLAEADYAAAAVQSRALAASGEAARLPSVTARGQFLLGRALTENPAATANERVAGIQALRAAARLYRRTDDDQLADILARLQSLTGHQAIEARKLPAPATDRAILPDSSHLNQAAIAAIVTLQEKEITTLTQQQLQQMLLVQQQQRKLNEYAFRSLNDSLLLLQQELLLDQQKAAVAQGKLERNFTLLLAVGALLFLLLLYSRFRSSRAYQTKLEAQNELLIAERQRSEELLLNILPVTIAAELKETGRATARKYEDATVLFADFLGFSSIAAELAPEELVQHLDAAFRNFDRIVRRYGLEKIKTIGDAYMCAGGLPEVSTDHSLRMVRAALEMQAYLAENSIFSARIGIHTGPLVAGVVGEDKFVYDIWGDTVNQAARLEAEGAPGRVAVSGRVAAKIAKHCTCVPAGTFFAKNIGEMERFWVSAATLQAPE